MIVRPILSVLLTLTICAMHCLSAMAQERCATVEYEKIRKNPKSEKEATFEKWLRDKSVQSPLKTQGTQKKQSATYKIPIVVHVIHNGEPVGTGTNISDAQILSQITVMNDDYKRLNADQTNTPAEFAGVAGSIDIEFILAKQDPEGLASTGIVRVKGSKFSWTLADNTLFKSHSYWPAENYLNIWVLNLTDFLGYAQFPVSTLPGLEQSPNDRLTDGVAVSYEVFGSINGAGGPFNLDSRYNKGRTATHEIGHFLGLRHIWGDQTTCTDSDYVTDTPPQSSSTTNCAVHPQPQCSGNKMFQNYLDYTDDACMNLFTVGQISRMNTVLNNSPRRLSLLTSPGSSDPISVNNDLGIKEITSPALTSCGGSIIPSIEVRNYGSNQVTSAKIQFKLNSTIIETKDVVLNLAFPETTIVSFSAINLAQATTNLLNFEILETNGGTDGQTSNNLKEISVKVATRANLPISESFNTLPSSWTIDNPDGLLTWQIIPAVNGAPGNKAIFINLFDYENTGVNDKLVTPVYDFTNVTGALLKFSRSYAPYPGEEADRLKVLVSTNCNFESNPVELYNKSGSQLATTQNFSGSFVPTSANQWLTESISLNQFAGQANVQFAFVAVNGYGNNLFLDNVSVASGEFTDITLLAVESPSPVSCKSTIHPVIRVKNSGTTIISNFAVYVSVNEGQSTTQIFNDVTLETGEERLFTLAPLSLINESNSISIILDNPNGLEDVLPADNSQVVTRIINAETDIIPVRQNFDGGVAPWSIVSQGLDETWVTASTNKKISMLYEAYSNPNKDEESWLVSPTLDFSRASKASVFYKLSYATRSLSANAEKFKILSSKDCGITFDKVLVDQSSVNFAVKESADPWVPESDLDWKQQFLDLDSLLGSKEGRIAFVVTNDNGNNLYIDDIEFFTDDDPNPLTISSLYTIYNRPLDFKITFNLPEREDVRLQIYNAMGQIVVDNQLPETLNQTYDVDLTGQASGVYIVRMQIGNQLTATKVFIGHF